MHSRTPTTKANFQTYPPYTTPNTTAIATSGVQLQLPHPVLPYLEANPCPVTDPGPHGDHRPLVGGPPPARNGTRPLALLGQEVDPPFGVWNSLNLNNMFDHKSWKCIWWGCRQVRLFFSVHSVHALLQMHYFGLNSSDIGDLALTFALQVFIATIEHQHCQNHITAN